MKTTATRINWVDVKRQLREGEEALTRLLGSDPHRVRAVLADRAKKLAVRRKSERHQNLGTPLLVFKAENECFGLPVSDVLGLTPYTGATLVPGGPSTLLGVVSERGDLWSILKLGRVLGLVEDAASSQGYVILLRRPGIAIGFQVDQLIGVQRVRIDESLPVDGDGCHRAVAAEGIVVLDLDRLLSRVDAI